MLLHEHLRCVLVYIGKITDSVDTMQHILESVCIYTYKLMYHIYIYIYIHKFIYNIYTYIIFRIVCSIFTAMLICFTFCLLNQHIKLCKQLSKLDLPIRNWSLQHANALPASRVLACYADVLSLNTTSVKCFIFFR